MLPDKLGELLHVALADLLAVEQDPAYVVNMGYWHNPRTWGPDYTEPPLCAVCLAGAVMATTLHADNQALMVPAMYPDSIRRKLMALDYLKDGRLPAAAATLNIVLPATMLHHFDMPRYDDNPERFKRKLASMAELLKKENL